MSDYQTAQRFQTDVNAVGPTALDSFDVTQGNIKIGKKPGADQPESWGYISKDCPADTPKFGEISEQLKDIDTTELDWLLASRDADTGNAIISLDFRTQQPAGVIAINVTINGQLIACTWDVTTSTYLSASVPDLAGVLAKNVGATMPLTIAIVI